MKSNLRASCDPSREFFFSFFILTSFIFSSGQNVTTDELHQESSKFLCESGGAVNFTYVCDGVPNCPDESDEKVCENEAILLYYTYQKEVYYTYYPDCKRFAKNLNSYYYEYSRYDCSSRRRDTVDLNITGIYLNNNKEFSTTAIPRQSGVVQITNIQISSNAPQLNIFYTMNNMNYSMMISRNGQNNVTTKTEDIQSVVVDWLTSNIYYISNSRIKVCDKKLVFCVTVQSKFIKNPVLLAISSKRRMLFWVEKKSSSQFYLSRYPLDKSLKPMHIRQDLKAPKWITVDTAQDRVYWLDIVNNVSSFYSTTFQGTDLEKISPGTSISNRTSTFAVFDNTIYWPDTDQKKIWKCLANECDHPNVYKTFISPESLDEFEIGHLIIDNRSAPPNKTKNPCATSYCSHWCLLESDTSLSCYCEGSDKPLLPVNKANGYCEDTTLIAAYQSSLYIIGLLNDTTFEPVIQKIDLNISSISTVTYNSIEGAIILTEEGQQKIYSWIPMERKLVLISDGGVGTINAIEFDNYANNLYWIDPKELSIKVMNLRTFAKVNILKGDPSYRPIDFTLIPANGYMAVLFLKKDSAVVVERISMDGGSYSRKILYEDSETDDPKSMSLHYLRETRLLCLLDRQTNEIRYFSETESEFKDMVNENSGGKIRSITSLKNSIIWSEDDLVIRKGIVQTSNFHITSARKISLGLEPHDGMVLKITPVVKSSIAESRFAKCLQNNGDCEGICLVSNKYSKFSCSCADDEELIDGTACRKLLKPTINSPSVSETPTSRTLESIESTPGTLENKTALGSLNSTQTLENKTFENETLITDRDSDFSENELVYVQLCPVCSISPPHPTPENSSTSKLVYVKLCPAHPAPSPPVERKDEKVPTSSFICPNATPQTLPSVQHFCAESQQHDTVIQVFYSVFIAVLAAFSGFSVGCLVSRRNLSKPHAIRFCAQNGTLELSQMKGGSTTTLCSKLLDETTKNMSGN